MSLAECKILQLEKISDVRGNLTYIEGQKHVSFEIKRVYYLYDVPAGADRGGHAHKELCQLLIAASGSFEISLDDGFEKKSIIMNRPNIGLFIPNLVWRDINNFSSGSVCLVLASEVYKQADYIRDYEEFKELMRSR